MRISDWSSDVCSSDLSRSWKRKTWSRRWKASSRPGWKSTPDMDQIAPANSYDVEAIRRDFPILSRQVHGKPLVYLDNGERKRVVEGKSVSVRVDLGGRRIIKKKRKNKRATETH